MRQFSSVFLFVGLAFATAGCSLTAPQYTASLENVQKLKDSNIGTVKVGGFTSSGESGNANPISLRGSSLNSPYNSTYSDYLAEALKQELSLADRYSATAQVEVSGVLKKNDLDASGFSTGLGDISARFIVKNAGTVKYDQTKSAHITWESSFVGATAIPRAQQNYPLLVQKLLAELFADPAFVSAVK